MGLFDRWREHQATHRADDAAEAEALAASMWSEPERGKCACVEHVEDLHDVEVPLSAQLADEDETPMTVGDLLECEALGAEPTAPSERWIHPHDGPREGPFHWNVWVGDEARMSYDDDAPLSLDEAIRQQPGVGAVEWADREVFYVEAGGMCRSGMLAAVGRALVDPRLRIAG
jgi:hypothetical protein